MSTLKLIASPSVYVIGRQSIDEAELQRFLDDNDVGGWKTDTDVAAERLVEVAGRTCYMSFAKPRPGGNSAYVSHLLDVGHGSCLEHAVWNLLVTGVSRSLTHELIRHRVGVSPSQLSQRYVDESTAGFVIPDALKEEVEAAIALFRGSWANPQFDADEVECLLNDKEYPLTYAQRAGVEWLRAIIQCRESYRYLSDYLTEKHKPAGVRRAEADPEYAEQLGGLVEMNATERRKNARQAARSVLPNATETKIFLTMNGRAARHFIELRASRHADAEIRRLACAIWEVLVKESVALFGDYERVALADGSAELVTKNRKV